MVETCKIVSECPFNRLKGDHNMNEKDYSISCVRFVAMCFIVICHILQQDNFSIKIINGRTIELAFWFNVGVQMFLFVSGYLYGRKKSLDVICFYRKGFSKLLTSYYIFIVIVLLLIFFYSKWSISFHEIIGLLTISGTTTGLGHLWFVQTISFCYLATPVLFAIINFIEKKDKFNYAYSLALFISVDFIVKYHFSTFSSTLINSYILGMLYSRIESNNKLRMLFRNNILVLCSIAILIQCSIDYLNIWKVPLSLIDAYQHLCEYGHVFLGVLLVYSIRCIFNKLKNRNIYYLLDWSDKYSYEVYLTHHLFIQSPLACVMFIPNKFIAISLAIVLTIIFAMVLNHISNFHFIKNRISTLNL